MLAMKAPADRRPCRLAGILAPDLVFDAEGRVREAGAKPHPETVGGVVAMLGQPAGKFQLACLVIACRDGGHVRPHDPVQQVGIARAPLIVVAAALVGTGDINGRRERPDARLDPALALDQVGGIGLGVPSKLADNRPLVADQPFVIDLVVDGVAVGDDAVAQRLAGRIAIDAVARMRGRGQDAMRA